MQNLSAREIHGQAEQTREAGDFPKALALADQALLAYQKEGDEKGFAEALTSRFLTLRHLYHETGDSNYLVLAKHTAMAAVEIAQSSKDPTALALPLFNLAKVQEELNEPSSACQTYQQSLDNLINNPPSEHNRAGVIADFKVHLYSCLYKSGDKSALEKLLQATTDLEGSNETKYNKDVWLSGAYMRLAEILRSNNPPQARENLQKAKDIIDTNPDLKLRAKQWEKLSIKLKF